MNIQNCNGYFGHFGRLGDRSVYGSVTGFLLPDRERPDDGLAEGLARTEHGCRELRLVRRIRTVLALDGHTLIVVIATSALACRAALKPVAGVNLDGWLGGQNLKLTAALRRVKLSRRLKLTSLIVVDHEAVVIPLTIVESREVSLDLLTDFLELPEIHRCTFPFSPIRFSAPIAFDGRKLQIYIVTKLVNTMPADAIYKLWIVADKIAKQQREKKVR